jgi:hypothetical protein
VLITHIILALILEFMYYLEVMIVLTPTEYITSNSIREFLVWLHEINMSWYHFKLEIKKSLVEQYIYIKNYSKSLSSYWFLSTYITIFIFLLVLSIWTRASGPRVRLDQLNNIVWVSILFTLFIMVIILLFLSF